MSFIRMYHPVDAQSAEACGVGSIDDGVHLQSCDVAAEDEDLPVEICSDVLRGCLVL